MKKQTFSATMLTLITALACIVLSGGGLVYYATAVRPGEFHMQATTVAKGFLTSQAQAIQQAHLEATIQATATANALYDLLTQTTYNPPMYNDSLNEQDNTGWEQSSNTGGECLFSNGSYHAEVLNGFGIQPCLDQSGTLTNFAFQVRMTISKGVSGGIIFRYSGSVGNSLNAYLFDISADGYGLFSIQNGQPIIYTNGFSPVVNLIPKQPNVLTVIAKGNNFYLYVNSQFVDRVSDNTFKSGEVGVFAFNGTDFTDAAFNNAEIWSL